MEKECSNTKVSRRPEARVAFPRFLLCMIAAAALSGCDPITLTAFGVGAATGVQHTLTGISYRTFSLPLANVRTGARTALQHMGITVATEEKTENGRRIKARAGDRDIEIELEAISPNATRMRSTARSGLFSDSATATEIILQTEKALGKG